MSWGARTSVAILLALVFAAVPLLLDRCAGVCEHTAASQSEPTCHAGVQTTRIGHQPISCGHDHEAMVTTLSDSAVPTLRALASIVEVTLAQTADVRVVLSRVAAFASPPRDPLSRQLSVSLRV
jgi:uncharacterized protein YceK